MPDTLKQQSLESASTEDLMIALCLKVNGSVHVKPKQGQELITSLPNVDDEACQGTISKCIGDPNNPRDWKVYTYF